MKIDQRLLTKNEYSRPYNRLKKVEKIVIHYVANAGSTAIANRNYFENLKNQGRIYASAHYIIDIDGSVVQCIPEEEMAYHAGNYQVNLCSIGIECCHPDVSGKFSDATINTLKELVNDIRKRYNILDSNIIRHYDVTRKKCPLYYVDNTRWNELKKQILSQSNNVIDSQNTLVKINTPVLNIRSGPDTNFNVVGKVYNGEVYTVIEKNNNWGKLKSGIGWICLDYVVNSFNMQSELGRYITLENLNLRKGPGTNFAKAYNNRFSGMYPKNQQFDVLEIKNQVWGRTVSGWVCLKYAKKM